MPLKHLQELGIQEGILPSGNAGGDLISRLHQLILFHGVDERTPQAFMELFVDALLYQLVFFKLSAHALPPKIKSFYDTMHAGKVQ